MTASTYAVVAVIAVVVIEAVTLLAPAGVVVAGASVDCALNGDKAPFPLRRAGGDGGSSGEPARPGWTVSWITASCVFPVLSVSVHISSSTSSLEEAGAWSDERPDPFTCPTATALPPAFDSAVSLSSSASTPIAPADAQAVRLVSLKILGSPHFDDEELEEGGNSCVLST